MMITNYKDGRSAGLYGSEEEEAFVDNWTVKFKTPIHCQQMFNHWDGKE